MDFICRRWIFRQHARVHAAAVAELEGLSGKALSAGTEELLETFRDGGGAEAGVSGRGFAAVGDFRCSIG